MYVVFSLEKKHLVVPQTYKFLTTYLAFLYCLCYLMQFYCLMYVFCAQRPFHRPVIFARAQHVHHIIRQESIFNISEHHNPRQGIGGGSERRIYRSHG